MLVTRKNIIAATLKIHDMGGQAAVEKLLELLESHPTIILRAVEVGVPPKPIPLFKIVVVQAGPDKINLIRAFREITGAGLADAKNWSEGLAYMGLPSGVFANGLAPELADRRLNEINSVLRRCNCPNAEKVAESAPVAPMPWKVG